MENKMNAMKKSGALGGLALAAFTGVSLGWSLSQPARGDGEAKGKDAAGPRYTVVQAGAAGLPVDRMLGSNGRTPGPAGVAPPALLLVAATVLPFCSK